MVMGMKFFHKTPRLNPSDGPLTSAERLMPISKVAGSALLAQGEPVQSLDPAAIMVNASWQYAYHVNYPMGVNGKTAIGHKATLGSGYTTIKEGELGFEACGDIPVTESLLEEAQYPPYAPEVCSLNEITAKFYQSDENFSVEYYCDKALVSARYYQKIANEKLDFYRFEFSQSLPLQDYSDSDACVEMTYYWSGKESEEAIAVADIYGNILRDSYHLQVQLNPVQPNQSFLHLMWMTKKI